MICISLDRSSPPPGTRWEVRQCPRCGLRRTDPPPTSEQIRDSYPAGYLGDTEKTLEEHFAGTLAQSRSWRDEMDKVRLVERYREGGAILDIGCGDAKFLWALDPDRWNRTGVEFQEETVDLVSSHMPDLELIAGDVWNENLEPEQFDVVTLWHVFEHLPEPHKVLRRLNQILKMDGILVLSVPNSASLQARIFGHLWYGLDVPRHLFHYTDDSLRLLLSYAGFSIEGNPCFSSKKNFHHIKHSLVNWSETRFGNRIPHYMLKWSLFFVLWYERLSGHWGNLTLVARRTEKPSPWPWEQDGSSASPS